jgi:hypothetical protein
MPKAVSTEGSALEVLRELVAIADKYPHLLQYVRLAAGKEPRFPKLVEHARELVAFEDRRAEAEKRREVGS